MKIAKNQKGFTLSEVIIATLLLATVGAGLIQGLVSAHKMRPSQVDRSLASNLAREQAEVLFEAVRQDWWNLTGRPLSLINAPGNAQNVTVGGKTFSRGYTVSAVSLTGDGGGQDYRKVTVTVQ